MDTRHAIRQLDPQIIGKIAAGEVVERPAYAIKELIENSVDAGATAITVEIQDGGLTYFKVIDNGCGIAPEDIRMAFARHATSKLRTAEELESIHTLGFRGEALASIAAVSVVEMVTRQAGSESGIKAIVRGGTIEPIRDAASPEGTAIVVRDLFFNTPARRKFLKKPATEASLVSDLVMRLILSRPDISFRLLSADRQIYHSPGNGNLRDAMFSVIGRDVLVSLVEVQGSVAGCAVHGFVGIGEAARGSRNMQTFILNGRYVRNQFLSQAVEEGCHERVMIGKYPICALHLTMPFEAVDVNVHPNKLEVRFQDERMLMAGLSGIVRGAFEVEPFQAAQRVVFREDTPIDASSPSEANETPIRMPRADTLSSAIPFALTNRPSVYLKDKAVAPSLATDRPPVFLTQENRMVSPGVRPQEPALIPEQGTVSAMGTDALKPIHAIGIAWLEYMFVEQEETLYIIDQHAAHERILYERFSRALEQQTVSQRLLVPQVIQLTHREHAALLESLDTLKEAGFDLEDFGDRSIKVLSVPMVMGMPQVKSFLGELADCLSEYRTIPTSEKRRDMLVKLACRKAVKAGDPLSRESVERLVEEMRSTGAPPTCPHGRPLVIAIAKGELDKRFRRVL